MKISSYQIESYIQNIDKAKIAAALVFGPESSIVSFNSQAIAKKIVADLADPFLVVHLSKERFAQEPSCLADEFYSFSMLGGRKLIWIKDVDANVSAAFKALFGQKDLAQKSENFILVQGGDLEKSNAVRKLAEENQAFAAIACYEDDEKTIKKFIENELKKNGFEPDAESIEYLYEKLGRNRQIIISEIAKIALYLDGDEINPDLVERAIGNQATISVNEFVESFATQNLSQALLQADYLQKNGFEAITLIRYLSNYVQKLYQAKTAIDIDKTSFDEAVKIQRLFFKAEAEFRKHLKNITREVLILWLLELEKVELKIKTTSTVSSKLLFAVFLQNSLKK